MTTKKILLICGAILLGGLLIILLIYSTEPTAQQEGATKESAMLVETVEAEAGNFRPQIAATGNVRAVEDITLSALVGGQVIRRDPSFVPGGFVKKGQLLLQIEPADYRNTLELRKSDLAQQQTELDVEMGRQLVAQQDLALVGGDSLSDREKTLVLRKPQLNAVRARLQAAQAAVDQARLNLQRTSIRAPFDAHILSQNVTVGSQVAPGDNLGQLVGTDFYWVEVTLPVTKIQWLKFPDEEVPEGAPVKVMNPSAWTKGTYREGELYGQVGSLDNQTRLARVLVKVTDPLATQKENDGKPALMIGSFVDAEIQAEEIPNTVRISRNYIRPNNTVWVMKDGKLQIRMVEIILTDAEYAYISEGLQAGEKVVTTNLSSVVEGVGLRTEGEAENTDD